MANLPKAWQDFIELSSQEGDDIASHIMKHLGSYKPGEDKNSAAVVFGCLAVAGSFIHGVPLDLRQAMMPAFIKVFEQHAGVEKN